MRHERIISKAVLDHDINEAVSNLREAFDDVSFVDKKIDNGCDDSEDDYVMMRSFDISKGTFKGYLRLFFGDQTRTVACYDLSAA